MYPTSPSLVTSVLSPISYTASSPITCEVPVVFVVKLRRHPNSDPPCLDRDQCQECQQNFPTRTALRLHLKNDHPEALIHRCQSCSATFKYSSMLQRHIKRQKIKGISALGDPEEGLEK
ncbi:Zinc finger and BTB domain-containing protein 40 [Portunus trituberculatus]|uniref:Zinc finger and BTB domain-containing protein 40 n=1 Tax=Portunus trituberculatus TaxID=210409 RepID=A0A5B7DPC2_PORTR|nr:Zinc finger and BTB domain-containing protein 40 [Portunus trituberculatus]